jgi:hypothetical protein
VLRRAAVAAVLAALALASPARAETVLELGHGQEPSVVAADDTTRALVSVDGGSTWSGPTPVGTGLGEVHDAELSPEGALVDTVHDAVEMTFQRVPLGGGVESRVVPLGRHTSTAWPRVTHLPDGRPAVIAQYALRRLGARVPAACADPYTAWSPFSAWRGLAKSGTSDADAGPTGT